jgi:hypothetical protein
MKYIVLLISLMFINSYLFSNEIWKKTFPLNGETSIRIKCADSINCVHLTTHEGFSKIYKSNDGGYTWSLIVDNHLKDFTQIHNIDYPERNHIFTTCNDKLLNINFIIHFDGDGKPLDTTFIEVTTEHPLVQIRDREIKMLDTNTGIANIGTYFIYTNDGWQTYKILFSDILFTRVTIQDNNIFGGYTASNNYRYIYTENGGITFDTIKIGFSITDIFFLNTQVGYLQGRKRLNPGVLPSEWGDVILKTIDGGRNWVSILDTIIDKYKTGAGHIFLLNEKKGTFVNSDAIVVESDDGFKTFKRVELPNPGDKPNNTAWISLAYSGNRPIVGASMWGVFTKIDTVYMNMKSPELIAPLNLSNSNNSRTDFQWSKINDINTYVFHLSSDPKFINLIKDDTINPPSFPTNYARQILDLENCEQYYWRVGAIKQNTIKWSETWSFSIYLDKTFLETPPNQATEIEYDTDLNWKELNGAERYHLQCAYDNGFNDLFYSQDTLTETKHLLGNLPEDKEIFWRVRGYCKEGFADWSEVWKFRTKKSTGVRYSEDFKGIVVSPNPAGDYIVISIPEINPTVNRRVDGLVDKIRIFNTLGIDLTPDLSIDGEEVRIDVSHLPAGVYFVKIDGMVEKFVKM